MPTIICLYTTCEQ